MDFLELEKFSPVRVWLRKNTWKLHIDMQGRIFTKIKGERHYFRDSSVFKNIIKLVNDFKGTKGGVFEIQRKDGRIFAYREGGWFTISRIKDYSPHILEII